MDIHQIFESVNLNQLNGYIQDQQEEHLFLDFKTVSKSDFSMSDRKTLAIALSGFANSSGGLVVWGIEARPNQDGIDCACGKAEIESLSLFLSRLNQLTGELVDPIVEGVRHRKIVSSGDRGFAVTLVPPSDSGPHMAKGREHRYYKRSGDSFYKMEHFDIEDMFGRRKKPKLSLKATRIAYSKAGKHHKLQVVLGIENSGRGTAKSPFLSVRIHPPYSIHPYGIDGNLHFGLRKLASSIGSIEEKYGASGDAVIHPGTVHDVTAVLVPVRAGMARVEDLVIDYKIAAEDMRLVEGQLVVEGSNFTAEIELHA